MEEIMNVENTALANPFNNESNFKMLMKMAHMPRNAPNA